MALRSGYKGFKKLLPGLKIIRPGTLGIDNDVLNKTFIDWPFNTETGVHNLNCFPYVPLNSTYLTMPVTVNSDGTILLNGTPTGDGSIFIHYRAGYSEPGKTDSNPIILPAGKYIFSKGETKTTIRLLKLVSGSGVNILTLLKGGAESGEFTLTETTQVGIAIDFAGNTTYDNVLVKPMIRIASDADTTYKPYAMTNRKLTEKVAVLDTKITGIECDKTAAGTYTLSATVDAQGAVTYAWTAVTP